MLTKEAMNPLAQSEMITKTTSELIAPETKKQFDGFQLKAQKTMAPKPKEAPRQSNMDMLKGQLIQRFALMNNNGAAKEESSENESSSEDE